MEIGGQIAYKSVQETWDIQATMGTQNPTCVFARSGVVRQLGDCETVGKYSLMKAANAGHTRR